MALLAAGFYLWQMQQTLGDEIRWAQQAEAAINAQATVIHSEETRAPVAVPGLASSVVRLEPTQLKRVRIPALGIDYRLLPEAIQGMPANKGKGLIETLFVVLPVAAYGEAVCGLDGLAPGDTIYLETEQRAFSFRVSEKAQRWSGEVVADSLPVIIVGFPCGEDGERLFVPASPVSN